MNETVLYFGSFNPIHNGHTSVAAYALDRGLCDSLWFVVSPRNPLKAAAELAPDTDRLEMARIAVEETLAGRDARVSDVEFSLPKPSYTIDTLRKLEQEYPGTGFSLLVGADIMEQVSLWKESDLLLENYRFLVYPRTGYDAGAARPRRMVYLESAPVWDYSSTEIREAVRRGGDISAMVSPGVGKYIENHRLWK